MLLLLLMYLSPLVAAVLFWRAQSVAIDRGALVSDGAGSIPGEPGDAGPTAREAMLAAVQPRLGLLRPASAAFLLPAAAVAIGVSLAAAAAYLAGAAFAVFCAATTYSATLSAAHAAARHGARAPLRAIWSEASSIAMALAALAAGTIGALAWFFADPSGAARIASFVFGASSGALFLSLGGRPLRNRQTAAAPASALAQEAATWTVTAPLHAHLLAVAASLMIAATAEPESLLFLGGLLAETETLRSELLLLPIAITVLSPVIAALSVPLAASMLERRGNSGLAAAERIAAVALAVAVVALVLVCGLAWAVAASFVAGLAVRELAAAGDSRIFRAWRAGRAAVAKLARPSPFVAIASAAAIVCGDHLAGWYGIAMAALGMTSMFATAAACTATRAISTFAETPLERPAFEDFAAGEASALLGATLAMLAAASPVLAAETIRHGQPLTLVMTSAPVLLVAAAVGAALAASWSQRFGRCEDEAEAVRTASAAVAIAAALPIVAGLLFSPAAAVGAAAGFGAWAAAAAPYAPGEESNSDLAPRLRRSALLGWASTIALAIVVAAPMLT